MPNIEPSKDAYEVRADYLESMLSRAYPEGPQDLEGEEHILAVCEWIERYRKRSKTYVRYIRL